MKIEFPKLLLPKNIQRMKTWATLPCDQFTHDDSFWESIDSELSNQLSTYNLIIPENELYKSNSDINSKINKVIENMDLYCKLDIYEEINNSCIIVSRNIDGKTRTGLIVLIDLEDYSFNSTGELSVRSTERIKEERLALREKYREISSLELSHSILLYDHADTDFLKQVITDGNSLEKLYSIELKKNDVVNAYKYSNIDELTSFFSTSNTGLRYDYMLVGDGNHSIASAKIHWEKIKRTKNIKNHLNNPFRYYFAEAININDPGLDFLPIHRYARIKAELYNEFMQKITTFFSIDFLTDDKYLDLSKQNFLKTFDILDDLLDKYSIEVSYPHLLDEVQKFIHNAHSILFIMPRINPRDLFSLIQNHGLLPKKSFSLGYPEEKRFYIEMRKLI